MFLFSKRKRIIKKAIDKTVKDFRDKAPKIYTHFYYGEVDIAPQNLVIWYLFKTDAELNIAKESGFCDEFSKATIGNLISLGYPSDAFNVSTQDNISDRISFEGGAEETHQLILNMFAHRKAVILFTTEEDIDRKSNGDYRLYFQ